MLQTADSLELTTDVELAGGVEEVLDGRVSLVVVTENLGSLQSPVMSSSELQFRPTCTDRWYPEEPVPRDRTHLSGL